MYSATSQVRLDPAAATAVAGGFLLRADTATAVTVTVHAPCVAPSYCSCSASPGFPSRRPSPPLLPPPAPDPAVERAADVFPHLTVLARRLTGVTAALTPATRRRRRCDIISGILMSSVLVQTRPGL
jgi:hypothetical protein